jgi:hypothetical protein
LSRASTTAFRGQRMGSRLLGGNVGLAAGRLLQMQLDHATTNLSQSVRRQ